MKAEFKDRLRTALEIRNMKQSELVEKTGIDKGQLSSWLSGKYKARQKNIALLSEALNVDEAWLMGFNVPMERTFVASDAIDYSKYSNLMPLPYSSGQTVPLIGTIACGTPILADENVEKEIKLPDNISADFCLRCKGDSMINARIHDGDIVYIKKQPMVENGQIAAVLIANTADMAEATLKRVYVYDNKIMLVAENPLYQPLSFDRDDMNNVKIIGKAVAFLSMIK